jgi:hypothetical protein
MPDSLRTALILGSRLRRETNTQATLTVVRYWPDQDERFVKEEVEPGATHFANLPCAIKRACIQPQAPSPKTQARARLLQAAVLQRLVQESCACNVQASPEVIQHELQTVPQRHLGLPPQIGPDLRDVRLALLRVVHGVFLVGDFRA